MYDFVPAIGYVLEPQSGHTADNRYVPLLVN